MLRTRNGRLFRVAPSSVPTEAGQRSRPPPARGEASDENEPNVRGAILCALGIASTLCACGTAALPGSATVNKQSPAIAVLPLQSPAAPTAPPSRPSIPDTSITLTPKTYESAGPCSGLQATAAFSYASPSCQLAWAQFFPRQLAGQDLMDASVMPKTVSIAAGVDPAAGRALATAFYRWQAFYDWAALNLNKSAIALLESPTAPTQLGRAIGEGTFVYSVPPCDMPTAIRVVHLSVAAAATIESRAGIAPDPLALVATWPACAGAEVAAPDGARIHIEMTPSSYVSVVTGAIVQTAPFGSVFDLTSSVDCVNNPGLSAECGGAPK